MSTPIQPGELSPEDPKYYAPPRWRSGEVTAPPIEPTLWSPEFPVEPVYAEWTSQNDETSFTGGPMSTDEPMRDSVLKSGKPSDQPGHGSIRRKVLAIATGVVIWTAFCVFLGLGRLDTISFAQLRNALPPASPPEIPVSERPQAVNLAVQRPVYDAPQKPAREVQTPTLAVADAIGEINTALPLAIKVFNDSPGTSILLSGLVAGTRVSSGAAAGEERWRIAVDDLPNTQVFPPDDFVGPMTVVAELRSGDDHAIAGTQMQLFWRGVAIKSGAAGEPAASPALAADAPKETSFGQALGLQSTAAQSSPGVKARNHISRHAGTKRRQHNSSSSLVMETDTVSRWKTAPTSNYATSAYSDVRAERRSFWSADLQSLIEGSWERCRYNCARERR